MRRIVQVPLKRRNARVETPTGVRPEVSGRTANVWQNSVLAIAQAKYSVCVLAPVQWRPFYLSSMMPRLARPELAVFRAIQAAAVRQRVFLSVSGAW